MNCKKCKFKTLMDYDVEQRCYICPDCNNEVYSEEEHE